MYILERLGGNYKQIGKSYNLIAGALLLACREANYFVLTITDIANWFNEHRHRVATKWIAEAIMEMKPFLQEQIAKMLTPTTEQYLPHLSNKLWESLGNTFNLLEFLQNANDLLKKISKEQRGHRNPRTFAVSIIYLTANQMGIPLTQKTASELYKVSDYSFRENAIWIRRTFP
jgi:transcription initiation factor TFIIIB Brf1 subunit/transcription initiation factor TFIIB